MSIVYDCTRPDSRAAGLTAAFTALRGGKLVVLPTDTVYGLGCDAFDGVGVTSLLRAKNRGRDMPVPVLVGSWQTIDGLVFAVSNQARNLVEAFWPGALSLVVQQAPSLSWDLGDARGTVMLRMPMHPVALELLREVGPMAVSSANVSGELPATTAALAREQLGSSVSVYLEGGPCAASVPSTIVDVTGECPLVLREGAISTAAIAEVLGVSAMDLLVR
ncbi:MAG: L-threonylcarbamoyladenylate synthase [Mycobacteriaceae bacterium]